MPLGKMPCGSCLKDSGRYLRQKSLWTSSPAVPEVSALWKCRTTTKPKMPLTPSTERSLTAGRSPSIKLNPKRTTAVVAAVVDITEAAAEDIDRGLIPPSTRTLPGTGLFFTALQAVFFLWPVKVDCPAHARSTRLFLVSPFNFPAKKAFNSLFLWGKVWSSLFSGGAYHYKTPFTIALPG